jgi:hypothetical protein
MKTSSIKDEISIPEYTFSLVPLAASALISRVMLAMGCESGVAAE